MPAMATRHFTGLSSYTPLIVHNSDSDAHDTAMDLSPSPIPFPDDHRIAMLGSNNAPASSSSATTTSSTPTSSSSTSAASSSSGGLMDDYDVPSCRICFEAGGELIVPCLCAGSSQFIHRQCLDDWRAVNTGKKPFSQCTTCHFNYSYEPSLSSQAEQTSTALRYRLLVVRDVTAVLVALSVLLLLVAYAVSAMDRAAGGNIVRLFPSAPPFVLFVLTALLLCLALLGLFGLLAKACGLEERLLRRHPMQERCCDGCCNGCGTLDCCNGYGGGWSGRGISGGGGGEGLIVFVVVIVIILAVFGIFFGILYGSAILERLTSRHIKRRWNQSLVEQYRVLDWNGNLAGLRAIGRKLN